MIETAPAQYKKQDGILSLSADGARAVRWNALTNAAATVTIPLPEITSTSAACKPTRTLQSSS